MLSVEFFTRRSSVCLSLLTMINPNQMCEVLLCVLRWLMRPILALNCLLQTEQALNCLLQIEEERGLRKKALLVTDALALAFRCACFCSTSLICFALYSPASLFMRPCHFAQFCAICSLYSVGMLKSLKVALRVSLYHFFWPPWEGFLTCSSP